MGVEIAGDIREDFTDKEVVLIHPRETLVNDKVNESFQQTVKTRLKTLGVKMILGTYSRFAPSVQWSFHTLL